MRSRDQTAGVVLAAGESRRFGSPKQLAMLDGRTLLEHVLSAALAAGLDPVVAVVPVWLTRPAAADSALRWVRNPHPDRGMGHSLQLGLAAVPLDCGGAVVLLGDEPFIPAAHIAALRAARGKTSIIATSGAGVLQPPVLLTREAFPLADELAGDAGLRDLLRADGARVTTVPLDVAVTDVDTPADLDRAHRIGHMFDSGDER